MPDQIQSYVDEAGDPTLFGSKRGSGVIVGNDGCSKFFIMGKLEVADPASLSQKLTALRHELLADPYFAGVESFKPERPKTAHGFHANNDLPEVRYQVFKLLREMGINLRFHAVVADKMVIASREIKRREEDPKARYQENSVYDGLIRELYGKFHHMAVQKSVASHTTSASPAGARATATRLCVKPSNMPSATSSPGSASVATPSGTSTFPIPTPQSAYKPQIISFGQSSGSTKRENHAFST